MNKERLILELKKINIGLSEEKIELLERFCSFLIEENKKTNLTAITSIEDIYLKHIYDSLTIIKAIDLKKHKTLLDIGSGAGLPGIILKIVYPHLMITLIDSNNKKTNFLNKIIQELSLTNIEVINIRAEELSKEKRESIELVTARAVANLRVLSELAIPFVKIGGYFIAMKSDVDEELKESIEIIDELGGAVKEVIKFKLPVENSIRSLVIIEKETKTPLTFPRPYDKIIKIPLKKKNK